MSVARLEIAFQENMPNMSSLLCVAARLGRLEVVKYLHEKQCPWSGSTSLSAAEYGHVEVYKYLVQNGCERHSYAIKSAAIGGHLEMVAYLYENKHYHDGDVSTAEVCTLAASRVNR